MENNGDLEIGGEKKKQGAENRMRTPCKNIQEDLGEIS